MRDPEQPLEPNVREPTVEELAEIATLLPRDGVAIITGDGRLGVPVVNDDERLPEPEGRG